MFEEIRDKTFEVPCMTCAGGCCKNGLKIVLSPHDVFQIRLGSGKSTKELFAKELVFIQDKPGDFIKAAIREQKSKICQFLGDGVCSIHKNRPRICRTFPVVAALDKGFVSAVEDCGYIPQKEGLEKKMETHTFNTWLLKNKVSQEAINLDEMNNQLWFNHILKLNQSDYDETEKRNLAMRLYLYDSWQEVFDLPEDIKKLDSLKAVEYALHLALDYVDELAQKKAS